MHITKKTCFTLVVDNFAIKYTNLDDAKHLIDALKKYYVITIDWNATKYIGLTIEWDYTKGKVHVHMPVYLPNALLQFNHLKPKKKQNLPHPHVIPQYGTKIQYASDADTSLPPSTKRRPNIYRRLQEPSFIMDGRLIVLFSPHSV